MPERFDRILSTTLAICAIGVTGTVIHREFAPPPRRQLPPLDRPAFVATWKDALPVGIEIGNHSAAVKVVEFADLECPYCRQFHEEVVRVMQKHPQDVSLVFVHFPLPGHRFARQAARAAECADTRGRFAEFVSLLYTQQDSIGMKSWGAFGREAGIPDTTSFRSCALDPSAIKRIDAGKAFGQGIQVTATPTVLVNGWRYGRAPDESELERIVQTTLKLGAPVDTGKKDVR
jgi:protein-disulfide isomerase